MKRTEDKKKDKWKDKVIDFVAIASIIMCMTGYVIAVWVALFLGLKLIATGIAVLLGDYIVHRLGDEK